MDKLGAHLAKFTYVTELLLRLPTDMVSPSDHIETPARDSPPHLMGNSNFGIPKLELSEELSAISKPVYKDELPKTLHIMPYHSDIIPGSFAFCHIDQMVAKAQIIKALELGFNHLRSNKLKVSAELTHTILRKPRIREVIVQLEDFFENFRVVHDFEDIKGVAPNPDVLASIGKKLTLLRRGWRLSGGTRSLCFLVLSLPFSLSSTLIFLLEFTGTLPSAATNPD